MNPVDLTVYECPFPKKRIGKINDGGYIIAEIPNVNYNLLLAGGILDDISFEQDFLDFYPTTKCIAYDGSIYNLPSIDERILFEKKYIGGTNTHISDQEIWTNLHNEINANNSIFVKMDIEGGEIPWIESINEEQMNKFEQIVMEFHFPFTEKEKDIFKKINNTHYLIHFHPNNAGLEPHTNTFSKTHNGVIIPNVFECTYVNKRFFSGRIPNKNKDLFPSEIDMKNDAGRVDININHYPFVN
jgi:hypothetical protein